jgi:hypothetical protein
MQGLEVLAILLLCFNYFKNLASTFEISERPAKSVLHVSQVNGAVTSEFSGNFFDNIVCKAADFLNMYILK